MLRFVFGRFSAYSRQDHTDRLSTPKQDDERKPCSGSLRTKEIRYASQDLRDSDGRSRAMMEWLRSNSPLSEWGLLLVAIATAGIAIWQIFAARRVQENQARPYVVAGIRRTGVHGVVELYVRNLGETAAHEVIMKMSPEPTSVSDSKYFKLFDSIPTLVPGDEWSTIWEVKAAERFQQSDVPSRFDVTLNYQGPNRKRKTPTHTDPFVIDWEVHRSTTYVAPRDIEDVARELEKIRKAIGTDKPGQHTLVEAGHELAERAGTEVTNDQADHDSKGSNQGAGWHALLDLALRKLGSR